MLGVPNCSVREKTYMLVDVGMGQYDIKEESTLCCSRTDIALERLASLTGA